MPTLGTSLKVNYKGTYSSSVTYNTNDIVYYNGTSYIALTTSTGQTPAVGTYWGVLAAQGAAGAAGAAGSNGTNGTSGSSLISTTKTAAYTAAVNDLVLANATSAAFTVTLPASPATNAVVGVKKTDSSSNVVTVVGSGATTIDGDVNCTLPVKEAAAQFIFDGTNWQIQSTAVVNTTGAGASLAPVFMTGGGTATANTYVYVDATSGTAVVTLPASPASGTVVAVKKVDSSTNSIQVYANGSSFDTTGNNFRLITLPGSYAQFMYAGSYWREIDAQSSFDNLYTSPVLSSGSWFSRRSFNSTSTSAYISAFSPAASTIYYIPTWLGNENIFFINALALCSSGAVATSGAAVRIGTYTCTAAGAPGTLITDYGLLTLIASTTTVSSMTVTASALPRGWMYFALSFNSTAAGNFVGTQGNPIHPARQGIAIADFVYGNLATGSAPGMYTSAGNSTATALASTAPTVTGLYAAFQPEVFFKVA